MNLTFLLKLIFRDEKDIRSNIFDRAASHNFMYTNKRSAYKLYTTSYYLVLTVWKH